MTNKRFILGRWNGSRVSPVSAIDFEFLSEYPPGTELEIKPRSKRTYPLHRTYWKALSETVKATDKWPTAEHLHKSLLQACGYVTVNHGLDGTPFITVDSTAFKAMNQAEFKGYFDRAMEKLAQSVGFDPLRWLEDAP